MEISRNKHEYLVLHISLNKSREKCWDSQCFKAKQSYQEAQNQSLNSIILYDFSCFCFKLIVLRHLGDESNEMFSRISFCFLIVQFDHLRFLRHHTMPSNTRRVKASTCFFFLSHLMLFHTFVTSDSETCLEESFNSVCRSNKGLHDEHHAE